MSPHRPQVLVIDDDPDICDLVETYLGAQGFQVHLAADTHRASQLLRQETIDVVLLDLNLGAENGLDFARELRRWWQGGLIFVTGQGDVVDRVVGLEIGADDYLPKPFDLRELLARIRSVTRRLRPDREQPIGTSRESAADTVYRFGGFLLCKSTRSLRAEDGREIELTSGEFDLLVVLVENAGIVMSRDALLERTHGRSAGPYDRTIDVLIARLRKKLGDSAGEPRLIKTVRGGGYLLARASAHV